MLVCGPTAVGATNLVTSFDTTLQPGVLHSFGLGASSDNRGYLAEITPTAPGQNGQTIQRCVIEPEFDCSQWSDVLRVQIASNDPALPVNIRIYDSAGLPIVTEFTTTLQPGAWQGTSLGPSSLSRGYLPEISPEGSGQNGQTIERYVVQPEFDGTQWNDMLRMQIGANDPPLQVSVRVYDTSANPLVANFNTSLQPGVPQGVILGPSSAQRAYVPEITPTGAGTNGQTLQRCVIEPEFSGTQWNDVLRVQADGSQALPVNVRVYAFQSSTNLARSESLAPAHANPSELGAFGATTSENSCRSGLRGPVRPSLAGEQAAGHRLAIFYAVPTDITPNPAVLARIKQATGDMQAWYQCATGGKTWELAFPETVRVYHALSNRQYYKDNGDWWGSLLGEMGASGLPIWSSGTVSAIWAHGAGWWAGAAQSCGVDCGTALLGVELFPEFNNPAFSGGTCPGAQGPGAWPCTPDGAYAHELGHTLGLPHPADVPALQAVAGHSIMQTHWNYPDFAAASERPWGLLTPERAVVRANPFMHEAISLLQTHSNCDVVNLPPTCPVPVAGFQRDASAPASFMATNISVGADAYYWTFGDGSASASADAAHHFSQIGVFPVTLRAVGSNSTIDTATTTVTVPTTDVPSTRPTAFLQMSQNRPNPFTRSTSLGYRLGDSGLVHLVVYGVEGRRLRTLANGYRPAGEYTATWDGRDDRGHRLPPGAYLATLRAGDQQVTRVVILRD
jgi:hypothetical protein